MAMLPILDRTDPCESGMHIFRVSQLIRIMYSSQTITRFRKYTHSPSHDTYDLFKCDNNLNKKNRIF